MNISKNGIDLIKKFEGCRLKAYTDAVGVLTIGYGHTKNVTADMEISEKEAENLLKSDLTRFEKCVDSYDAFYHWTQNEYDALVSFCFNLGNKLGQLTNNKKRSKKEIANKMLEYNKAGGQVLKGLEKRRAAECELFLNSTSSNCSGAIDALAHEVIAGKWGSGSTRKNMIYNAVQARVNELLR